MQWYRPILAAQEVTEQQWRVIRALAEAGPLEATELAKRACILGPSLTRIIKTLRDRKLITRTHHDKDRRRVLLDLTRGGKTLIGHILPQSAIVYSEIVNIVGEARIDGLLRELDELTRALGDE